MSKSKFKDGDIVFTRDDEAIVVRETYYDSGDEGWKCAGWVMRTEAYRYYSECDCYSNVDDYEKKLLAGVKEEVESRKKEIEETKKAVDRLVS